MKRSATIDLASLISPFPIMFQDTGQGLNPYFYELIRLVFGFPGVIPEAQNRWIRSSVKPGVVRWS